MSRPLDEARQRPEAAGRQLKVVAFGGGHGLAASLRALRKSSAKLDVDITAVVTVGDNGGSSGRLRAERDALLPPGDLRMALAALADEEPGHQTTVRLLQHRFAPVNNPDRRTTAPIATATTAAAAAGAGELNGRRLDGYDPLAGHAVGNLLLLGLMELTGDPVAALEHAAWMVGAKGRVLPMASHAVGIEAEVRGGDPARPQDVVTVRGQHAVAVTNGHVEALRIVPESPPACPRALTAIAEADWLIFGPGSWYTSVLPHLLVPELAAAIVASPARRLVTLNLAADNETAGLSVADHLAALHWYLAELRVDTVLADPAWVGEPEPVHRAAEALGARLVLAPLARDDGSPRHDPESLGTALVPVLGVDR
ncbi:2-phospho-L-lactate transferase CofD family protein [Actinoplanes sp. TFC3]|uniref:gluconeogenesis factor YvcK family protein n=1 Tax=Actinoplanes sp. TFC3 TaxID=1710355 RepID=UPI000AA0E8AE|nr:2-phospho-L-lactate transferase CofD family protein [Actinoplanes sp. TFC3]